eukprot:tig00021723_g23247.t1
MSTNSSTAASLFAKSVGPPSVTVSSSGRTLFWRRNGVADSASNATVASETGTGSATVLVSAGSGRWQVQSHVTSCAATVYYSYLGVASSATAYSTVHAKTVENVTVGTPIPQSTTSVTVPVSWALSALLRGRRDADGLPGERHDHGWGDERQRDRLGLPEMGASYTITCSGANLTAQVGGAAVGDGLVERGGRCFGAVSWNTTGASGTEPAYANVTVSCSSNGVADSASNATVASETGTGSATVLVSAGSGGGSARKDGGERDGGTPIPQSTTSVTVPVSWALSAVGYSGDNVAPTYGPLEVSCSGAGVTRTGSLASGTITAGATSANRGQSDGVRGTVTGRRLTSHRAPRQAREHELVDGSIAVRQVGGPPSVTSRRAGRTLFGGGVLEYDGGSGTEPAYANVTVSCSSNGVADSASNATVASETGTGSATLRATVYYSYLGVASSATAYSTVHAKTVENVTRGHVAPTYGPLEVSCSGAGVTRTGSLASGTITAGATSANVTVLGLPEMGASYTITCSGANLTAYAGTVTGAAPDFTPGAASSTMSTNSSTAASLFVGGAAVGDGLVERGGRCFGGGVLEYDGGSGTEPAYANVTVSCSSNGVADSASNATVASETGTGSATVLVSAGSGRWQVQSHVTSCAATVYYSYLGARKDGGERDGGDADPAVDDVGDGARELGALGGGVQRGHVAPTYGPLEVSCSGAGVTRTGSLASGTITAGATSANVTVLGLPEMGASYTITCSGANLTAYAGTVTGAAPDFTRAPRQAREHELVDGSIAVRQVGGAAVAKSVGPPSVTVSSSGADAVLAAVSWNTTGASGTEPAYANVTVSCSSNGVADSASNATVASETGTGSATVLVSAGSGRWQVQSHVTSCAATVYYSYLGWRRAPRRTRRTVENVTVGTPIPQSTTSVTVPVSWALSAVGYSGDTWRRRTGRWSGDNVAPTYGPLEVSCSGAGVTRTGSLASGTITAGATSANVTVLGLPEMGASYTITCSGANLTAYAGTVTGAAPDFTPGAASSTKSTNSSTAASLFVGGAAVGDGLVERGGRCFGAVSWNTTGASGTEPAYANVTVSCSSNGVADSASNATVASETGTGSATVLVSAGSGRWQVQSHVTSCAATVYYSYLGVASSATAYSTVHAKTVENVTVGTPIPQSTTSVTVPVSWALSAVGYSGDNVAPTYGRWR